MIDGTNTRTARNKKTRLPKAITAPLSNKDHTIPSPMPVRPYANNGKSSGKKLHDETARLHKNVCAVTWI